MNADLSIVVAAQNARDAISACLNSLLAQAGTINLQIIVADGSNDGTAAWVADHYPQVRLLVLQAPCALPKLLGAGVEAANGEIIAITEAHCVFPTNWCATVIKAHKEISGPVIGGAVEPGPNLSLSDWALYFADYGQFMSPLRPGPADEMPGENVSFKRTILEQAQKQGARFGQEGFWKTFFCKSLQQTGYTLMAEPKIVVVYNRQLTLTQIIRRRWQHGRCFGGLRANQLGTLHRLALRLAGGLLPFVLSGRLWRKVWSKNRYRSQFLMSLPLALTAVMAWSAGEWWGLLFGTGNSCDYV